MRKTFLAFLAIALLASCNKNDGNKPAAFRVALLLPGSDTDEGWNQLAAESLARIRSELGAETKIAVKVGVGEMARQAISYADDGYDVVICHGYEFSNVVPDIAKSHPKTHFIVGGCSSTVEGAVAVDFNLREASQLAGVVASSATRAKKVAFVGAMEVPTLLACVDGFQKGLSPGVTLLPSLWTESWDSPGKARDKAEVALAAGADVLYQDVDSAAVGVFQAVHDKSTAQKPLYAIGCNRNQNAKAPDVILGSVVIDVPKAYLDLCREAKEGKWKNRVALLGLADGCVDLVLNEANPAITADVKAKVAAAREKLLGK